MQVGWAASNNLQALSLSEHLLEKAHKCLIHYAHCFFIKANRLFHYNRSGCHQLVLFSLKHTCILWETYNTLGHHRFYPTCYILTDQFWWPSLNKDLNWYIRTCHQCQTCTLDKVVILPIIAFPAPLFQKAHINTMYLLTAHGYSYIVQA